MERMQTGPRKVRLAVLGVGALVFVAGGGLLLYALFGGEDPSSVPTPESEVLRLTVPGMKRVDDLPVYDAPPEGFEAALRKGSVHVSSTGFPWQEGANVYIAGHRLGYPGTRSYLVFRDIDKLEKGDEVTLTDANGTRYTYEIFKQFQYGPDAERVLEPVEGKNVVTLQSCTWPDYARRIAVQAELTDVREEAA